MSDEAASKARANERQKKHPPLSLNSWLHPLIYSLEKQNCQQRKLNLNRKDRSVCSFRAGITNFFSSDAMKSCNSGREKWSGNICPNSADRRGTDKPWSEHQKGIKVEKVTVKWTFGLIQNTGSAKNLNYANSVVLSSTSFIVKNTRWPCNQANWINNRARNFC